MSPSSLLSDTPYQLASSQLSFSAMKKDADMSLLQAFLAGKSDTFTLMGHSVHLQQQQGRDTLVISASISSTKPSKITNSSVNDNSHLKKVEEPSKIPPIVLSAKDIASLKSLSNLPEKSLDSLASYISPPSGTLNKPDIQTIETTSLVVDCVVRARIPTSGRGTCFLHVYTNNIDKHEHMAIVYGSDIISTSLNAVKHSSENDLTRKVRGAFPLEEYKMLVENRKLEVFDNIPLARIHSSCITGETIGSARCDCAEQLYEGMRRIGEEGRGVVVYLVQEGRGIGLVDKLRAYNLQDMGADTVTANVLLHHPPDGRSYEIATAILEDLNIPSVRLLTNNPDKIKQLQNDGIGISERIPMIPKGWLEIMGMMKQQMQDDKVVTRAQTTGNLSTLQHISHHEMKLSESDGYLITKVERMNHLLDIPPELKNYLENH
ncbi:GTP cyclohydrolase II [Nowakowskiella sp. JEL0078]|nr:GTP cyclohydrolase II [Nowakowskiella sp. JEL0078]